MSGLIPQHFIDDLISRADIVELQEITVLDTYLPEQLGEAELNDMIEQAIKDSGAESMRDMGKVMGQVKAKAAGRADMGVVGAKVKERLGAA